MKTLTQTQNELRNTIAVADNRDFQLLTTDSDLKDRIIDELNEGLKVVLIEIRKNTTTLGKIGAKISHFMSGMLEKYPNVGLDDSESHETVARFFAINYAPHAYDYIRYNVCWSS